MLHDFISKSLDVHKCCLIIELLSTGVSMFMTLSIKMCNFTEKQIVKENYLNWGEELNILRK